jgi:UDP-N-acetylmuramate--alanine ligase
MVEGIKARGHRAAFVVSGPDDLAQTLAHSVREGDMVVCLGAGDITKWAAGLADAIRERR